MALVYRRDEGCQGRFGLEADLGDEPRQDGRVTASQIAAASFASFLPRLR